MVRNIPLLLTNRIWTSPLYKAFVVLQKKLILDATFVGDLVLFRPNQGILKFKEQLI